MSEATQFKQRMILFACVLSFAYRFADSDDKNEENVSPMYVRVILTAVVGSGQQSN